MSLVDFIFFTLFIAVPAGAAVGALMFALWVIPRDLLKQHAAVKRRLRELGEDA